MKNPSKPRVKANKKLGQHFLTDTAIIEQIVTAINPEAADNLLEIGPGLGAITLPVLARARRLTAIELDRRVIPVLKENAKALGDLTLIEDDVLNIDYPTLLGQRSWHVFGNLPYNISTPILFTLTAQVGIKEMIFMLQKEVVERMTAQPGEKNYGRLSVMLQFQHEVFPLFDVPASAFNPPPKVMSAMVGMSRLATPRWFVKDKALFDSVVKQAFSMRRKTLKNNLKALISAKSLATLGIDAGLRAEVISGKQFADIANFLTGEHHE